MQAIPVHQLPNGHYVYIERCGTYSHQKPNLRVWCERHNTVEEAVLCFNQQAERE